MIVDEECEHRYGCLQTGNGKIKEPTICCSSCIIGTVYEPLVDWCHKGIVVVVSNKREYSGSFVWRYGNQLESRGWKDA